MEVSQSKGAPTLVKSLEVLDLDAPGGASATIRLWDTPEKIPQKAGVSWKDGSLFLDSKAGMNAFSLAPSKDAALRALVRRNPDSKAAQLTMRWHLEGGKATYYRLLLTGQRLELFAVAGETVDRIGDWPLPAAALAAEWVHLELRMIGDQITVTAEGATVGTVVDHAIAEPGAVGVYASANGYFRDIVYVPLDKTGGESATPATATKDAPFVNSLGMKFVPVPITGGPMDGQHVLFGVWDVRVQDYGAFAKVNKVDGVWTSQQMDGVPVSREPEYPVVGVSWDDAEAFCHWLTEKERAKGICHRG